MYHSTIEYRPVKHFSLTFFRKSRWLVGELRSSVNGLPLLRHSLNKPAARGRQPKMSTPIPKKIPNRPKGKPEGDANQVLEPRAGIKPATDCMMMLTFSSVSVSVNTFAAERFTSCRHIIAGQFIRPNKKTSSWLINRREPRRDIVFLGQSKACIRGNL